MKGSHLLLDITNVKDMTAIHSVVNLTQKMDDICSNYRYDVLNRYVYNFKPQGTSIVYTLCESHFTIHTYPEINYVAIDLYTCRENQELFYEEIAILLKEYFDGEIKQNMVVPREAC